MLLAHVLQLFGSCIGGDVPLLLSCAGHIFCPKPFPNLLMQLEAAHQAAAAEASSVSAQLQEQQAAAAAAAAKARGDQLVLAKEVKRLRGELAAAQQVWCSGLWCVWGARALAATISKVQSP